MYKEVNRKIYTRAEIFAASGLGLTLLVLWSFFEASFWFIAPDFILGLLCILAPKKYKKFLVAAIITSIFGGVFYYSLNLIHFEGLTEILVKTPFAAEKSMNFVSALFSNYGVIATLMQSITLIPFKIWTHFAVLYGFSPILYFLLAAVSRIFRFFIVAWIACFLGIKAKKWIKNNFVAFLAAYILLFVIGMLLLEA